MTDNTSTNFTREQYTQQIVSMLPPGKAFPRQEGTNLWKLLFSYAAQIKQVDDTATNLIADWFPSTTTNFLTEWQNSLGLPDKCVTYSSSFEDQRNQLVARLTISGQSTSDFIKSYAESFGYVVDVKEWGQIVCGVQSCGTVSCGPTDRSVESCLTINITNGKDPSLLICEISQFVPPYLSFYMFSNGNRVWSNV